MDEQGDGVDTVTFRGHRPWSTALVCLGVLPLVVMLPLALLAPAARSGFRDADLVPFLVVDALVAVVFVFAAVRARAEADAGRTRALRLVAGLAIPLGLVGGIALMVLHPAAGLGWMTACVVVAGGVLRRTPARLPEPSRAG